VRGVQRFVLFDLDDTLVGRAAGLRSWAEEFCGRRGLATLICSGVARCVDAWAISAAEGVAKPRHRLFEIAADRCGASLADGGWMVGDSATADITGGRTAGLKTCWISRGRPWPLPERSRDRIVGHVTEAISLLPT
jgi:FMN phosphatase YigB (HAD superfamily)